jgi:ribosome-associated heat shock protein Hsp15
VAEECGSRREGAVGRQPENSSPRDAARLDKWLWAARFHKTRALAVEAIGGGKVQVNEARAKRSKLIHAGDRVRIRKGPYEYQVTVLVPGSHRGSAKDAALLYEESEESRLSRERLAEQQRVAAKAFPSTKGRPTKKERRNIDRLKRRD